MITQERLEIILSNLLGELHEKVFEQNDTEFISYITNEIGITVEEMKELRSRNNFPIDIE